MTTIRCYYPTLQQVCYICFMLKKDKSTPPRSQVVPLLAQKFVHDYEDAIKDYDLSLRLEITEYLMEVVELINEYAQNEDQAVYKRFTELQEVLLQKYRKT